MRVLPGPTKSNSVLAWSPCGRFVVAGGTGDGVTIWDVSAGEPGARVLAGGHGGEALRFARGTGVLFVSFRSCGLWSYDPATGHQRRGLPYDYRTGHGAPALSDDGRTLVVRRSRYVNTGSVYAVAGYTVGDGGALAARWERPSERWLLSGRVDFVFRPGTDQLFGLSGEWGGPGGFAWYTAETGEAVGTLALESVRIGPWELSPDGARVAWFLNHALHVQPLDGSAARVLPAEPGEFRRGLAWAPDGRTLAYATGRLVRLIDADTFEERRAFDWGTGKPRAVAFSPDGLRAAVSGDAGRGWVTVFDLD
ncbi:MAG: WD40 repeat domain-containing protein [Planctomycetes bacterium]|nr:WD40 repeat domain-containing protein [Planctomycetota bacterium]